MKYLAVLFSLASVSFAASITTFTSQSSYDTAIGSHELFTFGLPNNTVITSVGTMLSVATLGGDPNGRVNGAQLCGSSAAALDCFKPLLLTFLQASKAFGFHDGDLTTDEEFVVILGFTNGDPSQQFVADLGGLPGFTPIFFGATSNVNISSVEIYSRTIGTTTIGSRANTLVDIDLPAGVPEPSALFTLGSGLLALAYWRQRAR